MQKLQIPERATHVEFIAGFLNLDFGTQEKDLQLSNIENLPINCTSSTITLMPAAAATGNGQSFYLIKVAFFQEANHVQYSLKNWAYKALQIMEVS